MQASGTDTELALRAAQGDATALEDLLGRHYLHVYRLAWRWVGSREDAQDVAQEVCVKVARRIGDYRGDAAVKTWLYRITVNAAKDHIRQQATRNAYESAFVQESLHSAQENTNDGGDSMDGSALYRLIHRLPEKIRDTLLLVYGEEMTHGDAARVLGCAETTISWRVFQGKRKLKALLKEHGV